MLGDGNSDKTPAKGDDIFNFLNQATEKKSTEDPFSAFATPTGFSTEKKQEGEDIFSVLSVKRKDEISKQNMGVLESIIEEQKVEEPIQESAKDAAWGDEDIELDDEPEQTGPQEKKKSCQFDMKESEADQDVELRSGA